MITSAGRVPYAEDPSRAPGLGQDGPVPPAEDDPTAGGGRWHRAAARLRRAGPGPWIGGLAVGLLYGGCTLAFAALADRFWSSDGPGPGVLSTLAAYAASGMLGIVALSAMGVFERERAARDQGATMCAIRVVRGAQPGVTRDWRQGRAQLSPGHLSFRGTRWQSLHLHLHRPTLELHPTSVGAEHRLPTSRESMWSLSSSYWIVLVTTPTATLEWALPRDNLAWARDQLALRVTA
jgi:hypothetical protein